MKINKTALMLLGVLIVDLIVFLPLIFKPRLKLKIHTKLLAKILFR
jgi:hypothetical protein